MAATLIGDNKSDPKLYAGSQSKRFVRLFPPPTTKQLMVILFASELGQTEGCRIARLHQTLLDYC
jgi:hypothetical protein